MGRTLHEILSKGEGAGLQDVGEKEMVRGNYRKPLTILDQSRSSNN